MKLADPEIIGLTRNALGDRYEDLDFISTEQAKEADKRREMLLSELSGSAGFAFKGSKPYLGELSPGCVRCGRGEWSCLFVGFECNASCFFCPGGRGDASGARSPTADGLVFAAPADFADYVRCFGVRAVAFSGGESLLEIDLVLDHLRELRRACGDELCVWLYTNGLLASDDTLSRLRGAGLDEIRFDIAAVDYALENVERAARIIDKVTIEVPAIPEDRELLQKLLQRMARIGVAHVNLHQMMLIGDNHDEIRRRGYSLTHGPTPSAVESELAALELIRHASDAGCDLSIQYCATVYKARWLERAQRVRVNPFVMGDLDSETRSGLVRRLWLEAPPVELIGIAAQLEELHPNAKRWRPDAENGRILLHPTLLKTVARWVWSVRVVYLEARLLPWEEETPDRSMTEPHRIGINERTAVGAALSRVSPVISLSPGDARRFEELYCSSDADPGPSGIDVVDRFERLGSGFPDYV